MERTPMRSNATPDEKGTVREPYLLLGVDALGNHHVFRTTDDTIHVVGDGRRHHVEDLRRPWDADEWMHYVADKYGWQRAEYGTGIAAVVGRALS
jgi:hypothetical protein